MFPFSVFHTRFRLIAVFLWALLSLPFPLLADDMQESPVIAGPAPSVVVPEPVTIRAEPQPMAPPLVEKRSSAVRVSVRPLLSMFLDRGGTLDQSTAVDRLDEFRPYDVSALSRETGSLWLYLDLSDVKDSAPHTLWLDLGTQMPGKMDVWLSSDGRNWQSVKAESRGVYDLLSAGRHGQVLVRMSGLPGLWFHPALCSSHAVMDSPDRLGTLLSLAGLALLGLLCLLLSVTERGEGRFWIGLLAFASMAQIWWGVPATPAGALGTSSFPGMFGAAVALFMLPHAGRVLMRTRVTSPFVDTLFLLFALPGACAAIVPLLPGMAWTARLLSLWPLAAVICFVPAIVLVFRGVQGSGPFALACLSMGGGAAVSLWGMLHGLESPWWGLAVQAGQTAGLLFLACAAPHRDEPAAEQELSLDVAPRRSGEIRANTYRDNSLAALRRTFRSTAEELFEEACRLDLALSRAGVDKDKVDIMTHADAMVAAARRLSENALDHPSPDALPESSTQVFELRQVIRKVFASVSEDAEKKGLGLAWYVAPQIGQKFRGDAARLTTLLTLILADSVRASTHGAVSLHVRRSPSSTHPGHLQFTVSDNGEALPPRGRQSALLSRVWELAAAHGGDFFVDTTPQGMELSFSMECAAMEADGVTERSVPAAGIDGESRTASPVILVSPDGLSRQMYAHYLDDMGYPLWEARDAEEAAQLYASSPAALVIFDGTLGEDDMVQGLAAIRMFEGEQALAAVPFLLLARDDMQAERMAKAGCDESILLPVVRRDLRAMTRWLMSPTEKRPVLSTQRITLAAVLAGAHSGTAKMQPKAVRRVAVQPAPAVADKESPEKDAAVTVTPEGEGKTAGKALSMEKDAGRQEKKSWLASLFHGHERSRKPLEVASAPVDFVPSPDAEEAKSSENSVSSLQTPASEGEVVELLAEEVLAEESGVQELTEQDRLSDVPVDGEMLIELEPELIHEVPEDRISEAGPRVEVPEEKESVSPDDDEKVAELADRPLDTITEMLNDISEALLHGDVQGIRSGARSLSGFADRYGMHTLADMARCFRAAWEEGDVEAAAQIVEEMRAEAARL
ncbi:hypothetical protein [uncultured Mailhella sp.]|uniref:hypothetical protein n=1 Tax=uncultured Mailhella sp. TaxID=1981031 RepID=UPI0025E7E63E|nr:hypothetical protein [uncultured Mailhella sp.]